MTPGAIFRFSRPRFPRSSAITMRVSFLVTLVISLLLLTESRRLRQNGPNDDWQKYLPSNWRSLPQYREYKGAPYCGPCRYWPSGSTPGDESACRYWDKCKPGANGNGGKNCGPDAAFVNDNWLGHCENVFTGRYP